MPAREVFCAQGVYAFENVGILFGKDAAAIFEQELRVAFFLAGEDLGDEHRRYRRERFLNRRAAGFSNEHVMFAQQRGDVAHPTEDACIGSVWGDAFGQLRRQRGVVSDGYGCGDILALKELGSNLAGAFAIAVDHEQDFKSLRGAGVWTHEGFCVKTRRDWESVVEDELIGDACVSQNSGALWVRYDKSIGALAMPDGVNRDGVCDDGKRWQ